MYCCCCKLLLETCCDKLIPFSCSRMCAQLSVSQRSRFRIRDGRRSGCLWFLLRKSRGVRSRRAPDGIRLGEQSCRNNKLNRSDLCDEHKSGPDGAQGVSSGRTAAPRGSSLSSRFSPSPPPGPRLLQHVSEFVTVGVRSAALLPASAFINV